MAAQRLDKIIASTGRWSRREVKDLVRQGRVTVDGVPARSAEEKADPEQAVIAVNGEKLNWRRYTWVMLNKPAGYLSATEDGRGATVLDLLSQDLQRQGLFPVGRLDKDTEGLLLLTNEGGLAHELLSPKKHVDKEYYVRVAGRLTEADSAAFAAGLHLDDGLSLPTGGIADPDLRRGERGLCDFAGGKISPNQTDAGVSGKAGAVFGARSHGQFAVGSGSGAGCVPFADQRGMAGISKTDGGDRKTSKLQQKGK